MKPQQSCTHAQLLTRLSCFVHLKQEQADYFSDFAAARIFMAV